MTIESCKAVLVTAWSMLIATNALASTLTLPDPKINAYQYGDFYSYALSILAVTYFSNLNGSNNPYYVAASAGQIKALPILATGSDGKKVTQNAQGMDNAYATPGGSHSASTFSTDGGAALGTGQGVISDQDNTWDINLSTLTNFLGGNDMTILFDNNQDTNRDLNAWGQVSIRDSSGVLPTLYFDFTSTKQNNDGIPGGDVTTYNSPGQWTPSAGDYVDVKGKIYYNGAWIDENLGTNQAAYAITSTEINEFLRTWSAATSSYDVMSFYVSMTDLNGGYEQIYLTAGSVDTPAAATPEPGTMLLMGVGGLGTVFLRRRKPRADV